MRRRQKERDYTAELKSETGAYISQFHTQQKAFKKLQ